MYGVDGEKVKSCVEEWIKTAKSEEIKEYWNTNIMCPEDDISKEYDLENLDEEDVGNLVEFYIEYATDSSIIWSTYIGGGDTPLFFGSEVYSFDCCTTFSLSEMLKEINCKEEEYKTQYKDLLANEYLPNKLKELLGNIQPDISVVFGTS